MVRFNNIKPMLNILICIYNIKLHLKCFCTLIGWLLSMVIVAYFVGSLFRPFIPRLIITGECGRIIFFLMSLMF